MKTDLLFENCPFITSTNITLSRIGITDCDPLWEIMREEKLYRFEREQPAQTRMQAEYKIEEADLLFEQKKAVVLGVYANTDLTHLIGWVELRNADTEMNMLELRFLFGCRCAGTEHPAEAVGALCRYLFEMVRVNRIQMNCLAEDVEKQRILEKCGFIREGVLRECYRWERHGVINLAFYAMLASDYLFLKNTRSIAVGNTALENASAES